MNGSSNASPSLPAGPRPDGPPLHAGGTVQPGRWRNAHLINLILIAVVIGLSVTWWRELPGRIPVHFDLSGNVDRWGSKGTMWWAFSALAVVGTALMYGAAALSRRYPQIVNLPRKVRIPDLPPEAQIRVISLAQGMLYWLATAMNLTWLLLLAAVRQAALGAPQRAARLVFGSVGVGVVLVPAVLIALYIPMVRIAKQSKRPLG
jgi:uncharacterized membrane protein